MQESVIRIRSELIKVFGSCKVEARNPDGPGEEGIFDCYSNHFRNASPKVRLWNLPGAFLILHLKNIKIK